MTVRIVADSTSGLTKEVSEKFDITIIPYYAYKEQKTFVEDQNFDYIRYYQEMRQDKKLPTTSHPTFQDILATYCKLASHSNEPIIHLTISSKMTETYELALQAARECSQVTIEIYDTGQAIAHEALTTIEAARFAKTGATIEKILSFLGEIKPKIDEVIVVDTLKYLARGGRIGRAQALLGTLLPVKPLLGFRDGIVTPHGTARTHTKALDFIIGKIRQDMNRLNGTTLRAVIEDADNTEETNMLREKLLKTFDCDELYNIKMSIVSGTHIGPGAWGVAYYII